MRYWALIGLILAAACERATPSAPPAPPEPPEPWHPFEARRWTTSPSDRELVSAILGTGGTEPERARLGDLVTSVLHEFIDCRHHDALHDQLECLDSELAIARRGFAEYVERYRLTALQAAFLTVAEPTAASFNTKAWHIGDAQMRKDLWPDEPYDDKWAYPTSSVAELRQLAAGLDRELTAFRARVEPVIPPLFAEDMASAPRPYEWPNYFVRMAYDSLRIATGRGYDRSCCSMYTELVEHGVPTRLTPEPPDR